MSAQTGTVPFWPLVRLHVDAFRRRSSPGWLGLSALVVQSTVALWAYERRTAPDGEALCLLGARRGRLVITAVGLLFACEAAGRLWWPAGVGLAAALFVPALPAVVLGARAVPMKFRLKRFSPRGHRVFVRSLVSGRRGAGAELVGALVREADAKGWSLMLDAAAISLVPYYGRFGFVPVAPVVAGAKGAVRMWRPPGGAVRPSAAVGGERG
jgi:hypothetical protein